jgi:hypothetical protein
MLLKSIAHDGHSGIQLLPIFSGQWKMLHLWIWIGFGEVGFIPQNLVI